MEDRIMVFFIIFGLIIFGLAVIIGFTNNIESNNIHTSNSESDIDPVGSESISSVDDNSDVESDSVSGDISKSEWLNIALEKGMDYSFASSFFDKYDYDGNGEWSYSEWSDAYSDAQYAAYG